MRVLVRLCVRLAEGDLETGVRVLLPDRVCVGDDVARALLLPLVRVGEVLLDTVRDLVAANAADEAEEVLVRVAALLLDGVLVRLVLPVPLMLLLGVEEYTEGVGDADTEPLLVVDIVDVILAVMVADREISDRIEMPW